MKQPIQEFFDDFRQEFMLEAEINRDLQLPEFLRSVTKELIEPGHIEGHEYCHYRHPRGHMRIDGYWFNDEDDSLALFISDFDSRLELETITKTQVNTAFDQAVRFFKACKDRNLCKNLEETSPEYGLARDIRDMQDSIRKIDFFLLSERIISDRLQSIPDATIDTVRVSFHVWDISRIYRQRSSKEHREVLDISLEDLEEKGLPCLPVDTKSSIYPTYLVVVPATVLSKLYGKYGTRLLEQNIRCFLQARSKINKGIRKTIISEPEMFFAYNNGVTATAQGIKTKQSRQGLEIVRIKDLQIVNGGQTTASLYHTERKEKASLDKISVQMKLSVIGKEESDSIVPQISEYANTQNRVSAADFFSNHPFHIRMEEFSRRIWAPAQPGAQRQSKWFYERARGQYIDAQSKLSNSGKKRFQAEYPRQQMFTKTDLAKFEKVWGEKPHIVNSGAQKNFAAFAGEIGKEWKKKEAVFNEYYFRRVISRAILFRKTERLVSGQTWYGGGYRANIVIYTLALLGFVCSQNKKSIDFEGIWKKQSVSDDFDKALCQAAKQAYDVIVRPKAGLSNVTEWCKKELCWQQVQKQAAKTWGLLPAGFKNELTSESEVTHEEKEAIKTQIMDNGIEAQKRVISYPGRAWKAFLRKASAAEILSHKEVGLLNAAARLPAKIPSEKQCIAIIGILEKAEQNGLAIDNQ